MNAFLRSCAVFAIVAGFAAESFGQTSSGSSSSTGSSSTGTSSGSGSSSGIGSGNSTGSTGTSGSTTPFAGNVAAGFGTQSTGTTATATKTGTSTTIPTASNPLAKSYVNPYAVGAVGTTSRTGAATAAKAFGQPVFATTATTTQTTSISSTSNHVGFNELNLPRGPRYSTQLSPDVPLVGPTPIVLQQRAADVLANASRIPSRAGMRVEMQGSLLVLSGQAANEHDRTLAENMLRITPGITDVENRIVIPGQPGQPSPIQP